MELESLGREADFCDRHSGLFLLSMVAARLRHLIHFSDSDGEGGIESSGAVFTG